DILAKLAQENQQSELEKEAERKKREYYEAVIAQADADFYGDKFDKAAQKYQEALMIYPNEEYPKNQIKAIDAAKAKYLAEQEKKKKLKKPTKMPWPSNRMSNILKIKLMR